MLHIITNFNVLVAGILFYCIWCPIVGQIFIYLQLDFLYHLAILLIFNFNFKLKYDK